MATDQSGELEYYRTIEDLFATLRGVPHTLSPKDFHLLRDWWADEVPLAAVRAGITETFAKRNDRGETEPIVTLGYCRHAVRAHAKRIAEMQVGGHDETSPPDDQSSPRQPLSRLASRLRSVAEDQRVNNSRLADQIEGIAASVETAVELPPAAIEEHLFALETAMLGNCFEALETSRRTDIEDRAQAAAEATTTSPDARARAFRAHRDREIRRLLSLPRLELDL